MTTASPAVLDVSGLPQHAPGVRSPLWWAVLLLVAIEGTGMGVLLVSLFYVRGNHQMWPPPSAGAGAGAVRLAAFQLALLVASAPAMALAVRASRRERFIPMRRWFAISTALGATMLVVRAFELPRIAMRWDTNVYGSLFWMTFGLHAAHVLTGVLENAMLLVLFYLARSRVQEKHFGDVEASALLWFFSVAEWLPAFAVLYIDPILRAR
jgi:cytochrome c oxidase subunit III